MHLLPRERGAEDVSSLCAVGSSSRSSFRSELVFGATPDILLSTPYF